MTSDKDKELITKGAVKEELNKIHPLHMYMKIKDTYWDVWPVADVLAAIDALEPAKPEDVTVILSKVHDIIDELGEMAPGKGVPNKISVRVLLGVLDKLDKYPVPPDECQDAVSLFRKQAVDVLAANGRFSEAKLIKEFRFIPPVLPAKRSEEPDYKAMYFEGDATIKKVYVTVKEHIERRFVKIEDEHTPVSRETDVREKPEGKVL